MGLKELGDTLAVEDRDYSLVVDILAEAGDYTVAGPVGEAADYTVAGPAAGAVDCMVVEAAAGIGAGASNVVEALREVENPINTFPILI